MFDQLYKKNTKIAVIGDSLLDIYHNGSVKSISPEAPVPILLSPINNPQQLPGGAANVCQQFTYFPASVDLYSLIDREFLDIVKKNSSFSYSCCEWLPEGNKVPRKIRYFSGNDCLFRHDIEQPNYNLSEEELIYLRESLFDEFVHNEYSFVILSNYNKGLFSEDFAQKIIKHCNKLNIPTLVDPKNNINYWLGCTYFKPNLQEAKNLTKCDLWEDAILSLQNKLGKKTNIVITDSDNGVYVLEGNIYSCYSPTKTNLNNVNSVIGAGDCYAAICGLLLSNDYSLKDTVKYAYLGGKEYVKAQHNSPILLNSIKSQVLGSSGKVINTVEELSKILQYHQDKKIVCTNGCFDILHCGHLATFKLAKEYADILIVLINSDESIRRLKGGERPFVTAQQRKEMVSAISEVDYVFEFSTDTPYEMIDFIEPSFIVKGGEYSGKQVAPVNFSGKIVYCPMVDELSTTKLIAKLGEL